MKNNTIYTLLIGLCMLLSGADLFASSHREAPLISNDPLADNVDLYAFRSPDNPDMITIIATYVPMQLPHGGPNYFTFGENIRYEIHVDNDASIPGDEVTYRFTFRQINEDPTTFFNIRLGKQNLKTTYTLEKSVDGGMTFTTIIENGIVPPNNIGPRSIESGVGLGTTYQTLFSSALTNASTGEVVFAGPVDDPFFVDLGGIFDLGNAPRQAGKPVDGLACMNVSAIAIQVPIANLLKSGAPATPTSILDSDYVIGVWASASRPAVRVLSAEDDAQYSGDWVQVSRLGMPLTNEAVIPVGRKDFWNSLSPYEEIGETTLDEYFYNPELALYMDDDLFGGAVPAFGPLRIQKASLGSFDFTNGADGLYGLKGNPALAGTALDDAVFGTLLLPAPGKPRSVDLWPAFHTGVPNVIPYQLATGKGGNPLAAGKPFVNNFLPNGGDMLRLNMAVPPTPRDDAFFSPLGLVQAAAIGLTVAPYNATTELEFIPNMDGFPNGRRLEDDVTRIELQAVSGVVLAAIGLWYDDYDPATSPSPVTQDLVNVLSYTTGVEQNDEAFTSAFPYLAMPHSGTGDCSGRIYQGGPDAEPMRSGSFFVSSNNQKRVALFDILDDASLTYTTFVNRAGDADGIHYDEAGDRLYQLNRTDNVIDVYANVMTNLRNGVPPVYMMSSTSDFTNGREISVVANKLVVAQDADAGNGQINQFVLYDIDDSGITYNKTYTTDINLWGIQLVGNTLFAIEDNSANLVRYDDFFSLPGGSITGDQVISIASMIRTHGLVYEADIDRMILTDVGAASSATDGAVTVIDSYTTAAADGTISDEEQVRIEGPMSQLGNPVDVAFDPVQNLILVAERANQGGVVLSFDVPVQSGDAAPRSSQLFGGASAVYRSGSQKEYTLATKGDLFISSNTTNAVGIASVLEDRNLSISSFMGQAQDADGIYYDADADVLYQLNRTDNVINAYSRVKENLAMGMLPVLTATSTSDFTNGREIAVAGDRMVVAQDADAGNGQANRLLVYKFSPNEIILKKSYDVSINLWGIHADVNTLYAIVDNSDQLAVFDDFFENLDGALTPSRIITIEDMVRTHGLTYDAETDLMVLTDVGEASSAEDGAVFIVNDFTAAAADGTISANERILIKGPATRLGNPVDVAFKRDLGVVYVAERANGGGRILGFDLFGEVDRVPFFDEAFAGASAVFIDDVVSEEDPITSTQNPEIGAFILKAYPNPTADFVQLNWEGEVFAGRKVIEILNAEGKVIRNEWMDGKVKTIDMTRLQSGVYFFRILNGSKNSVVKIFKM